MVNEVLNFTLTPPPRVPPYAVPICLPTSGNNDGLKNLAENGVRS